MRWLIVTASVLALTGSAAEPVAGADVGIGARVAAADAFVTTIKLAMVVDLLSRQRGGAWRASTPADR